MESAVVKMLSEYMKKGGRGLTFSPDIEKKIEDEEYQRRRERDEAAKALKAPKKKDTGGFVRG